MIQKCIDTGAPNRSSVDIDRYDASRVVGGKYRADPGTRSHVQNFTIVIYELRVDLRSEELTGAKQFRIEHTRRNDKGHATHPLHAEIIVSIFPQQPIVQANRLAEESHHQRGSSEADGVLS